MRRIDASLRKTGALRDKFLKFLTSRRHRPSRTRPLYDPAPCGQLDLDPQKKLIFTDETGLSPKMARLRGRAIRGEHCRAGVPHGHWKTTTFTGALCLTAMTAPFVYDGAVNGNVFLAYVEQCCYRPLSPGILSSWTICPRTKRPGCARPSSASPTVPTPTPLKMPSQSRRPCCGLGQRERSMPVVGCGRRIDAPLHADRMRKLLQRCWI